MPVYVLVCVGVRGRVDVDVVGAGAMLKFGSRSDVSNECRCTVRLLDDNEVIECDIKVGPAPTTATPPWHPEPNLT